VIRIQPIVVDTDNRMHRYQACRIHLAIRSLLVGHVLLAGPMVPSDLELPVVHYFLRCYQALHFVRVNLVRQDFLSVRDIHVLLVHHLDLENQAGRVDQGIQVVLHRQDIPALPVLHNYFLLRFDQVHQVLQVRQKDHRVLADPVSQNIVDSQHYPHNMELHQPTGNCRYRVVQPDRELHHFQGNPLDQLVRADIAAPMVYIGTSVEDLQSFDVLDEIGYRMNFRVDEMVV